MTHSRLFPGFGAGEAVAPLAALGFTDASYGNDMCPRFVNLSRRLVVWVDHVNPAERECEGPRFTVQESDEEGNPRFNGAYVCTDSLPEVIQRLSHAVGPF